MKTVKMDLLRGKLILLTIAAFIFAFFYAEYEADLYGKRLADNSIKEVKAISDFIIVDEIEKWQLDESDLSNQYYKALKESLTAFRLDSKEIRFVYLIKKVDEEVYFMIDSEVETSADYSPPGQNYYDLSEEGRLVFEEGQSKFVNPHTDRWGTWISVFVPLFRNGQNDVSAVLAVDYEAKAWIDEINRYHRIVFFNALVIIALGLFIYSLYRMNRLLRVKAKELKKSQNLFESVFNQAPVGVSIVQGGGQVDMYNEKYAKILGHGIGDVSKLDWREITYFEDLEKDEALFRKFNSGIMDSYEMEKRYIRSDGTPIWVNMKIARLNMEDSKDNSYMLILEDINDRKKYEYELMESERNKSVLLNNLPGMAFTRKADQPFAFKFLSSGCLELTGYSAESLIETGDDSYQNIILEAYRIPLKEQWVNAVLNDEKYSMAYEVKALDGTTKWVMEVGQPHFEMGRASVIEGIIVDITELKERENKILYMSEHDYLTGALNRRRFEEIKSEMDCAEQLPLSVIMGDINGIRVINDAFGHQEGDQMIRQAAQLIISVVRDRGYVARTGGGEFSVLLPRTDNHNVSKLISELTEAIKTHNLKQTNLTKQLSITLGYGTRTDFSKNIKDVIVDAEAHMFKLKLIQRKSYRSSLISSIMAAMYARSQETEEHSKRLSQFSTGIGQSLNLTQKSLSELELLSMLHDIGKIGIPDHILNKPGKLTEDEWVIMKKHSEIGYRIILSSPELEGIADYVLHHHERWDGTGYPDGQKGEEIPLLARILSVADAYDAMTEDRVYRKALSKETAIEELRSGAGKQFDPKIVQLFVEEILKP